MPTANSTVKEGSKVDDAFSKAESVINAKKIDVVKEQPVQKKNDGQLLKDFVNKNKLALEKNGKTYLMVDAWQYVCRMKGLIPTFISNKTDADDKGVFSVITTCELRNSNGVLVSQSSTVAASNEEFLSDKPEYAVWGMSETRALSRAVKNVFGYIARDAGYQATPWEEIN